MHATTVVLLSASLLMLFTQHHGSSNVEAFPLFSRFTSPLSMPSADCNTKTNFTSLNALLQGSRIHIPDSNDFNAGTFLGSKLHINLFNGSCGNILIGDVHVSLIPPLVPNTTQLSLHYEILVEEFSMNCTLDWRYEWSIFHGNGSNARIYAENSVIRTILQVSLNEEASMDNALPNSCSITDCTPTIQVTDIDFERKGVVSSVLDVFESLMRTMVEQRIQEVICAALVRLGNETLPKAFYQVTSTLKPYLKGGDRRVNMTIQDMLSAEKRQVSLLDHTIDNVWIHFSRPEEYVGRFVPFIWSKLLALLSSAQALSIMGDKGKFSITKVHDLVINQIVRYYFLGKDNELDIPFKSLKIGGPTKVGGIQVLSDGSIQYSAEGALAEITLNLTKVKVFGLDSLKIFDPFRLLQGANLTFNNYFNWEFLLFEIGLSLEIKVSDVQSSIVPSSNRICVKENFSFSAQFYDLVIAFSTLMAINRSRLGAEQIRSFLHTEDILTTVARSIDALRITPLSVDNSDMNYSLSSQLGRQGFGELILAGGRIIYDVYKGPYIDAAPSIFHVVINNWLSKYTSSHNDPAVLSHQHIPVPPNGIINFGDLLLPEWDAVRVGGVGNSPYGNLFRTIKHGMNTLASSLLPSLLNEMVRGRLTKEQSNVSGTLSFRGTIYQRNMTIDAGGLKGDLSLRVFNCRIKNIDSITQPLQLLEPMDTHQLNISASLGMESRPVSVTLYATFSLFSSVGVINNTISIDVEIPALNVYLTVLMLISEESFLSFQLKDSLNKHCWLAMMTAPSLDMYGMRKENSSSLLLSNIIIDFDDLKVKVRCQPCSSPSIQDLGERLESPTYQQEVFSTVRHFADWGQKISGKILGSKIDRILYSAQFLCHDKFYKSQNFTIFEVNMPHRNSMIKMMIMISVLISMALIMITVRFIVQFSVKRRNKIWFGSSGLSRFSHSLSELFPKLDDAKYSMRSTGALFRSPEIPRCVRWGIPLLTIGNVVLYFSGHISHCATVKLVVHFAGQTLKVDNLFNVSLVQSSVQMWRADARSMAILVFILQVLWPYSNQVINLLVWTAPQSVVSMRKREQLLVYLDTFSKWGIINIFIIIFSISSFNISVKGPTFLSFVPDDFYLINFMVVPRWGIYANLIAQIISQSSTQVIMYYQYRVGATATAQNNSNIDVRLESIPVEVNLHDCPQTHRQSLQRVALCNHTFNHGPYKSRTRFCVRKGVNPALLLASFTAVSFVTWGCAVPSFALQVKGITGLAMKLSGGYNEAALNHSILSVVNIINAQSAFYGSIYDKIGTALLSTMLLTTVLVIPLLRIVALVLRWFAPLKPATANKIMMFLKYSPAWTWLDVYMITIIILIWQLGPVSFLAMNRYCDSLRPVLGLLALYGVIDKSDAQCFHLQTELSDAVYLIVVSDLLLRVVNHFTVLAARQQELNEWRSIEFQQDMISESELFSQRCVHVEFTDFYAWLLHKCDEDYNESAD